MNYVTWFSHSLSPIDKSDWNSVHMGFPGVFPVKPAKNIITLDKKCTKPHEGAGIAQSWGQILFDHSWWIRIFLNFFILIFSCIPLLQERTTAGSSAPGSSYIRPWGFPFHKKSWGQYWFRIRKESELKPFAPLLSSPFVCKISKNIKLFHVI